MKRSTALLFIFSVLFLVGVGVWLGLRVSGTTRAQSVSPYSAVYLSTGDVYFGKLSWFPSPHLKDVWFLQRSVDANNQSQVNILPFTSAFWGPSDTVSLNPKQIIFWARLRSDSDVARLIANPSLLEQSPAAQEPAGEVQNSQR